MTRRSLSVVLGAVLLAPALISSGAADAARRAAAAHRRRAPARLLVYSQEWSLWPSRSTLPAGVVLVQLWNRGQDAHNVTVQRLGPGGSLRGRTQAVAVTQSGRISDGVWRLGPGRYELYCSLPQHRARGMRTVIRVR